jgi:hypothetical protein
MLLIGFNPSVKNRVYARRERGVAATLHLQVFHELTGPDAHVFLVTSTAAKHLRSECVTKVLSVAGVPFDGNNRRQTRQ